MSSSRSTSSARRTPARTGSTSNRATSQSTRGVTSSNRVANSAAQDRRTVSNNSRASSSASRSASNAVRSRNVPTTNVADMFHAKYGRLDTESELEKRIIKQLESELIKVKKQHEKSIAEAANLQRLLDERGREHDKAAKKFHSLRKQLDDLNDQLARTKDEKVQVGMLVERQKEQTLAASGNLNRYHIAVKDLQKKVGELQEQRNLAETTNASMKQEIKKLNSETASLEQSNAALQRQIDKLSELMYLKFE